MRWGIAAGRNRTWRNALAWLRKVQISCGWFRISLGLVKDLFNKSIYWRVDLGFIWVWFKTIYGMLWKLGLGYISGWFKETGRIFPTSFTGNRLFTPFTLSEFGCKPSVASVTSQRAQLDPATFQPPKDLRPSG